MDSYAVVAGALEQIINDEFAAEQITAIHDNLHESRGWEGIEVGIAPVNQAPNPSNKAVMQTTVQVRFYDLWDKEIDPTQQVDPHRITGFADRFRRKVESSQATAGGASNDVWFFEVIRIDYPDDPTGNKTRFTATVVATGDNTALTQRL